MNMPDDLPFTNRELSWLSFNRRVLSEAARQDLPLLERLKFLAITASNMDEFFQVRVGGLNALKMTGSRQKDPSGMTPTQQLQAIRREVLTFTQDQYDILNQELLPQLAEQGVILEQQANLHPEHRSAITSYFHDFIFPLLTPIAWDDSFDIRSLPSLQIIYVAKLRDGEEDRYAFIPIPASLPRFVSVATSGTGEGFLLLEKVIRDHLHELFPEEELLATGTFRLTRNTDIAVEEDDTGDLAHEMEKVLNARQFSNLVRLQVQKGIPSDLSRFITSVTHAASSQIYRIPGPLALSDFMQLATQGNLEHLQGENWPVYDSPQIDPDLSMFEQIAERDILLHHPYESFTPMLRLLEEAAGDPQTIAIKMVLYRTAKNSSIIDSLIRAANNGKHVTVLVELKARFDEARNLARADQLQRAGAQVIYGVRGLKTHAKVLLIARNENGRLRRYCHFGTGNYNESTARLYTDHSYLTVRHEFGHDASLFFNAVTGRSKLLQFQKIYPAPTHMKARLLELIDAERQLAKQGDHALIMAKMNSLQHPELINALYQASQAGVEILLNIRGICCLQTGHPLAKNIRVISIIDRYLEHSRLFYFHQAGSPEVYFSSADWMSRNLDKRIELMIPVEDPYAKRRVISCLENTFKDNLQAHSILPDGTSQRLSPKKKQKPFRSQEYFHRRVKSAVRAREREHAQTFQPHRPTQS